MSQGEDQDCSVQLCVLGYIYHLLRIETVLKHNGTKIYFNWSQNCKNNTAIFHS